ncbi:MAG: hypothetical protein F6K28_23220 [Microcoleus sp. SIO2G3]|nr:hypothetical protein [Microcoleus sp. SIO2G3]
MSGAVRSGLLVPKAIAILVNAEVRSLYLMLMLDGSTCWAAKASTQPMETGDRT